MRPALQRPIIASIILAVVLAAAPALGQSGPSGASAFAHVQHLAGVIGPRVSGSPAERQAADYLAAQLRQYGYTVEFHAFQVPFFEARQVQLHVLGATARAVQVEALMLSASTPPDGVEAELVTAGLGRPEDLEGRRVAGAIVLVERGQITFREKAANAAARGARAVVVYNNQPGIVVGTLQQRSEIPAVIISQEEGRALVEASQRGGVRARLLVDAVNEFRAARNVVGTRRGTTRPNEVIVVGGHYDSVPGSPGANDNASGVAASLEAARILASAPLSRTVQIVLFSGEEQGLHGSFAFASDRRHGIVAMINLDMVGWGERLMAGNSSGRDDSVVDVAVDVAQRLGIPLNRGRTGGSDHVSFERQGIPAVFFTRGIDPHYHRPTDLPQNVDPAHLEEVARLVVGIVQDLSQARASGVRARTRRG